MLGIDEQMTNYTGEIERRGKCDEMSTWSVLIQKRRRRMRIDVTLHLAATVEVIGLSINRYCYDRLLTSYPVDPNIM